MDEQELQNFVDKRIEAVLGNMQKFQKIPDHAHTGVDGSPKVDPVNLLPYAIQTANPTDTAQEGVFRLVNASGTYRIYYRVNNGWHYAGLT